MFVNCFPQDPFNGDKYVVMSYELACLTEDDRKNK